MPAGPDAIMMCIQAGQSAPDDAIGMNRPNGQRK